MENPVQKQQGISPSHATIALQLTQKNSEIITKMVMEYDIAVSMIRAKDDEIANLKKEVEKGKLQIEELLPK